MRGGTARTSGSWARRLARPLRDLWIELRIAWWIMSSRIRSGSTRSTDRRQGRDPIDLWTVLGQTWMDEDLTLPAIWPTACEKGRRRKGRARTYLRLLSWLGAANCTSGGPRSARRWSAKPTPDAKMNCSPNGDDCQRS